MDSSFNDIYAVKQRKQNAEYKTVKKLSKIIAGLVGLGVIGIGGLKLAEYQAEKIVRADFERSVAEQKVKGVHNAKLKEVSVDLLARTIIGRELSAHYKDKVGSFVINVPYWDITGVNLLDIFTRPKAVRSHSMSFAGLSLDGTIEAKDEPEKFTLSIADLSIEGTNLGELGEELEKLDDMTPEESRALIDRIVIQQLVMSDINLSIPDGNITLNKITMDGLEQASAKGYSFEGISFKENGHQYAGLKAMTYKGNDFVSGLASKGEVLISDLYFEIPKEKRDDVLSQTLLEAGLDQLKMDIHADYDWDIEKRVLQYKEFSVDLKKAFKVAFSASITDAPTLAQIRAVQAIGLQGWKPENELPPVVSEMLQAVNLEGLSVSLEDKALMANFLEKKAKEENISREALALGLGVVSQNVLKQLVSPELVSKINGDVLDFLQKGGVFSLGLHAKNNKPVNIASAIPVAMIMPKMLMNQFEISSSHQETVH